MFVKVHHIPTPPPAGGLLIYRGGKARRKKGTSMNVSLPRTFWGFCFHTAIFRGKIRKHKHRPPKTRFDSIEREGRVALQYGNQWTSPCSSFRVVVLRWWLGHRLLYGLLGRSCSCCWLRWRWDFLVSVLREHRREGRDLICNSREHDWFAFLGLFTSLLTIHLQCTELLRSARLFHQISTQMKIFLFFTSSDYWFHFDFTSHSLFTASSTKSYAAIIRVDECVC